MMGRTTVRLIGVSSMKQRDHRPRWEVLTDKMGTFETHAPDPFDVLFPEEESNGEQVDLLLWALDQMTEQERDVLTMRHVAGMKHDEIAEMMGWTDRRWSSVYLGRAEKKLRDLLTSSPRTS